MRRRAVLTGVLAWVLVVAVASGVTWAVIEGAGQSLLAGENPVAETLAVPTPSRTAPASQPAAPESTHHRRPRPSGSTEQSTAPASPAAVPSPAASTSAAPRAVSPAPEERAVERTWAGPPGLVTVRCTGSRTSLRSATPSNGYRVEVDRGSERIEVHFESASREYKVEARCVGGSPRFTVEGGGEREHDD